VIFFKFFVPTTTEWPSIGSQQSESVPAKVYGLWGGGGESCILLVPTSNELLPYTFHFERALLPDINSSYTIVFVRIKMISFRHVVVSLMPLCIIFAVVSSHSKDVGESKYLYLSFFYDRLRTIQWEKSVTIRALLHVV
jgi:hypothetical protein